MNGKPVVALDDVRDDVQLAYDYFEERVGGTGEQFLARYFGVADRIASNPRLFRLKFDDYRRALVPRSYFAIYYFEEPDRSVILAVVDARRDPRLIREMVRDRRTEPR